MSKMTTIEEVQARMKELKDKRAAELLEIQMKIDEARSQKDAAEKALKEATERMDLAAFDQAKAAQAKAANAIEMYSARQEQLNRKKMITEEESDAVIDSLLEAGQNLAKEYDAKAVTLVRQLGSLQADYRRQKAQLQGIIATWTNEIHANYQTRGRTLYYDPATGEHTDRSNKPVAVSVQEPSQLDGILFDMLQRARPYVG